MKELNKTFLTGRTVSDVELKTVGDKTLGKVSIAVNNGFGDKETVDYIDMEIWGKQAENLAEYAKKGKLLLVEGRLRQDKWEKDGKKFSKIVLVIDDFKFLSSKNDQ